MPVALLGMAYEALAAGDTSPLLDLLRDDFEWVEPELAGYPLSGVHRGPAGVRDGVLDRLGGLLEGLVIQADEVVEGDVRVVATGVMRGRPNGADEDWELPFAHVWEIVDGEPVRVRTYFDRSRLTLAASRRRLAEAADDLLDQAAEIRRQWDRLGDALRSAGADEDPESAEAGSANARLAAVDMAQDGSTREEVEAFLRDDLGLDDPGTIVDEVFGPPDAAVPAPPVDDEAAAIEANRLSRLFARNRE